MLVETPREYIDPEFNEEGEPFDYFLETALDNGKYTPDMRKIMSDKHHLLFTYGTLQKGQSRHSLLEEAELIGKAVTTVVNYRLWNYESGGYPVALVDSYMPKPTQTPRAAVYGEVYLVPNYIIPVLDHIENNGRMFHRVRTFVTLSSSRYKNTRPILGAWIYNGINKFWDADFLESDCSLCRIVNHKTENLPKFYTW